MKFLKFVQVESRPVASWSATSKSLHPDVIKDPMHDNKGKPLKFRLGGKLKIKKNSPCFFSCYVSSTIVAAGRFIDASFLVLNVLVADSTEPQILSPPF